MRFWLTLQVAICCCFECVSFVCFSLILHDNFAGLNWVWKWLYAFWRKAAAQINNDILRLGISGLDYAKEVEEGLGRGYRQQQDWSLKGNLGYMKPAFHGSKIAYTLLRFCCSCCTPIHFPWNSLCCPNSKAKRKFRVLVKDILESH